MSRRASRRRVPDAPEPARRKAGRGKHAAPRASGLGRTAQRLIAPAVLVVLTVGVLMLGAFPTRTFLEQRRTAATAESRLQELEAANEAARVEAEALRTDAVVEQIARREYGLARPGEEIYHVLPDAEDPVRVPEAWPFNALGSTLER
jgi:cell division protein FtsB